MYNNIVSCWRCGADIKDKDSFMLELSCYDHEGRLHSMFPPSMGETSMDTARVRRPVCEACMRALSRGLFYDMEEESDCMVQDSPASMPSCLDKCSDEDHGAGSCDCGGQCAEHSCTCKKDASGENGPDATTCSKKGDAPYVPHIRGYRVTRKPRVRIVSVPAGIDLFAVNLLRLLDFI